MKEMEAELGQPIIRDYRGGAGGTIAMEMAAKRAGGRLYDVRRVDVAGDQRRRLRQPQGRHHQGFRAGQR